jgi:LDH2 family malate/lactate/ureidoglycolate dehydrogenase
MTDTQRYVVPESLHNEWVARVYRSRGYGADEAACAAKWCGLATRHGIKTHAALKALHLEEVFGRARGLCVPGAEMEVLPGKFGAAVRVDARRKLGQPVAEWCMNRCCELADQYGVGVVAVDNAFHYLWGGGYVLEAARRGYIAYTNCTSTLAEVVPFGGKYPTIGTNPHSWAFPTRGVVGFPILIDWATSAVASGRVQQLAREGKPLPPEVALDADGNYTTDPAKVAALVPFGGRVAGHKGYSLGLIDELFAAYIGGSLPTLRGRPGASPTKHTASFFFQAIHPDAIASNDFATAAARDANVKSVVADILGHGNDAAMLPGQLEAKAADECARAGGLLFSRAEVIELAQVLREAGLDDLRVDSLRTVP